MAALVLGYAVYVLLILFTTGALALLTDSSFDLGPEWIPLGIGAVAAVVFLPRFLWHK